MKKNTARIIKTILLLFFLSNILSAQTFDMQSLPSDQSQLGLRFLRPYFDSDRGLSTFSGVYELTANMPVTSNWNILTSIPYITTSINKDYGFFKYKFDESGIGNIFIGMQRNPETIDSKRSVLTFGLFLPTADEKAATSGTSANFLELQKYVPKLFTLYFNYAYHSINENGFRFGIEFGPHFMIPTEKGGDSEIYLHYGIAPGIKVNKFLFNLELLGIMVLTESPDDFADRFIHAINFGVAWTGNSVVPKVFYKKYLKEFLSDSIIGVLGVEVSILLN